jgi:hypothetical protein
MTFIVQIYEFVAFSCVFSVCSEIFTIWNAQGKAQSPTLATLCVSYNLYGLHLCKFSAFTLKYLCSVRLDRKLFQTYSQTDRQSDIQTKKTLCSLSPSQTPPLTRERPLPYMIGSVKVTFQTSTTLPIYLCLREVSQ